jgi:3-oxocholest-4-en-26-oyl-CoA dehydrogenase beta subunit
MSADESRPTTANERRRITVDFTLSDEQLAVQEVARTIAENCGRSGLAAKPRDAAWQDEEPGQPVTASRLWRELSRSDLLGICVPEEFGGSGGDLTGLCVLLEECGRGLAQAPVLETIVAALAIDRFGTAAQRERWLPAVRTGAILTIAPATGNRPVKATWRDGHWLLSGDQPFVPYLSDAQRVLLTAGAGASVVAFLVDPRSSGAELVPYATTSGLPEGELRLTDVAVDAADVLDGHVGEAAGHDGDAVRQWVWDRAVVGTGALLTGIASGALTATARYTNQREQFGRAIATFQAVALHAGDAFIDTEAMRLTTWQAAWRLAAGWPAAREVSIAKFWASEGASRVTEVAQHLHGGMGVVTDYPLHRYLLWAKQLELSLGTATWHLGRLADQLG